MLHYLLYLLQQLQKLVLVGSSSEIIVVQNKSNNVDHDTRLKTIHRVDKLFNSQKYKK